MQTTFRVDGKDFEELASALAYVSEKHFGGAAVGYEREPDRDGYNYEVFSAESSDTDTVTIFHVVA